MDAYRSALEHQADALALVSVWIERAVVAHKGDDEARLAELERGAIDLEAKIEAKLAAARAGGAPIAWDRLRRALDLSPTEQRALWVLIATELSAKHRAIVKFLVDDPARPNPDVGLVELLVYGDAKDRLLDEMAPDAPLYRWRLIETIGRRPDDAPFLLRALRVNRRVLELVSGIDRFDREVGAVGVLIAEPPGLEHLQLDDALKREVTELVREGGTLVAITGNEGAGRKSLALGAARACGRAVLMIRCVDLPRDPHELAQLARAAMREGRLADAVLVLDGVEALAADEDGRGDRGRFLDALAIYPGAVIATAAKSEGRPVASTRSLVVIDVPVPPEAARLILWRAALDDVGEAAAIASSRYAMTGGLIARAAASARARAAARGEARATSADVHAGVRSTLDVKMARLGVRIAWRQTWDDLVLPEDSVIEIREFIARVQHRRLVYETWGFARKVAKGLGLSSLFTGPPGTGKTMVAGLIADALALDLYQVDLSRIVSKYVGETEKNLAALFDAAEVGHSILLFDEADSLFAKRTEVKTSVDRYANLEVNYLLQRMEAFAGITILTTNHDTAIDEAFRRRISFKIDFPMPDQDEREKLWRVMVPKEAALADDVDWEKLATRFAMSGGYIRNAVLRAAFLAADEGGAIAMKHLLRGGTLEYSAMGKIISHA